MTSLDLYRSLYEAEWIRRSEIRQATALPIGLSIAVASVLMLYLQTFSFSSVWTTPFLLASCVVGAVALLGAVYMLARSLFGPHYRRIPYPSQIRDYEEALRGFYASQPDGDDVTLREWEGFLLNRFVDAATHNGENNANAGEYLYKANQLMLVAVVALAIGAPSFVIDLRISAQQTSTSVARTEVKSMQDEADREATARRSAQGSTANDPKTTPSARKPPTGAPSQERIERVVQRIAKPVAPENINIRTAMEEPNRERAESDRQQQRQRQRRQPGKQPTHSRDTDDGDVAGDKTSGASKH